MWIVRENKNGKTFPVIREARVEEYKKANKENDDVDLTIYKVVESKSGALKLEKIS
jgi:hypothetical protein